MDDEDSEVLLRLPRSGHNNVINRM